jgi:4a-hydroxytetrahydrobiopterin dehydratase
MSKIRIFSQKEIFEELKNLPGWNFANDKISKEFMFDDFLTAVDFVNKLAPICEENDHHPDIHIFYNKILFDLQRFDVGGKVTDKDMLMAHKIEGLYSEYKLAL